MSTLLDRFLRYVQIDTQSDPNSQTVPSTEKQKNLGKLLVEELLALGVTDAELNEFGYLYATMPASPGFENEPVICLCAHMDTSPDVTGEGVKPLVHPNYQGQPIALPDDSSIVLSIEDDPALQHQLGNTLITASGNTLLGADNKAGVAEIMTVAERLLAAENTVKHGKIRLLFTPDEEIGRGADHVNLTKLGADFAYTLDGEERGSIEDETWNADGASVVFEGISAHPGYAKGKMVNALKVAASFLAQLPQVQSPEETDGRDGFVHPVQLRGIAEKAMVDLILRNYTLEGLADQHSLIRAAAEKAVSAWPGSQVSVSFSEQYRNMKSVLDQHPEVMDRALKAIAKVGLTPIQKSIRGGTDGARFTLMGLPCPNIFAGEHAFHSKKEWVSLEDMEMAVQVALEIVRAPSAE